MNNQVLSIEQMQELIDMGIDTSSASCIWWNFAEIGFALMFLNDGRESLTIEKMKENHGAENVIPTFTLQDILEMLPNIEGYYYPDLRRVTKMAWQVIYKPQLGELPWLDEYGKTSLEAVFNMLKWCKQNNYI